MIPVIIIAVVFTGLGGAIFWAAPRGKLAGVSNAMLSQKKGVGTMINLTIALTMIGFGIVIPAIFLVINHNDTSAGVTGGIKLTSSEISGRTLFAEHCAVCHTLAAASAVGETGPNLDQLKPNMQIILRTLQNGCLASPTSTELSQICLGQGTMPADIVQGQDAVNVAKFVAAVAGHGKGA